MTLRFTPPTDLSRYEAFIFDCDGTLIDSMPIHFLAWREGLQAAGANFDFTWEEFLSRAGMSTQGTLDELEASYGCKLDRLILASVKAGVYEQLVPSIQEIPEVVAFARSLAGRYPLAVASGSHRDEIIHVLSRLDLLDLFSTVITPEDVAFGKPAPDMFLLAASRLEAAPSTCLVMEDGASGILAAQNAGMDCLIVSPSPEPLLR